jgi:hypothetical protein
MVSIRNIVFGAPDGEWVEDHWVGGQRELARFYAELLGWEVIREDWPVVAVDEVTLPRLAFGEGPTPSYRAPRWPDPAFPQQLHLDLPCADMDVGEAHAIDVGAVKLREEKKFRVFADPFGHPFCIYESPDAPSSPLAGRIGGIVVDCFSPRALSGFYEELLDMRERVDDDPSWVSIVGNDPSMPRLSFQRSDAELPRWPDPEFPQQVHLDLHAEDVKEAGELAERLGAVRMRDMGGSCAVFADPSQHPFCLCAPGE